VGAAIGDVLGLAAGVAVSPLPIVAMILVLATPGGRVNGIVFGLGWVLGLAVLGAVVLALAGPADASDGGQPAAWTGWLELLLGVGRCCWRRGSGGAGPCRAVSRRCPGGWRASTGSSLTIAAAATIAGAGLAGGEQAVVLAVFVLIGSAVVYLVAGEGAGPDPR
jgi:Sap, sulfolipid-1-addressing protein